MVAIAIAACGHAREPAAVSSAPSPIAASRQLVVGVVDGWDATAATLARFERDAGGAWRAVGAAWPAVIGRSGTAWGRGLHGDGAPPGATGPVKREGDGRAPAGAYSIVASYGYAAAPVDGARLPYHALDAGWRCVDDPASSHYNHVLDAAGLNPDWSSAETMRRDDVLYTWVIEIGHNRAAAPAAGSCIFFHVWSGTGSSTAGCTAMAQPALEAVLGWLDPAHNPAYVLLPRAEYAARAAAWGLPAVP